MLLLNRANDALLSPQRPESLMQHLSETFLRNILYPQKLSDGKVALAITNSTHKSSQKTHRKLSRLEPNHMASD